MTRDFERTQPGNPHQLTVKQHCFPRRSIARFANDDGRVHAHLIGPGRTVFLKPEDNNFCALRAWNQKVESGLMKEVEDAYQSLVDKIAGGHIVRRLRRDEKQIITDMYVLWHCRWHWNKNPISDQELSGVLGVTHEYSKDEQELLEKIGVTAIRPDLTISGRDLTAVQMVRNFSVQRKSMRDCGWGILVSRHADFIVPDNAAGRVILPVTPSICLDGTEGYRVANEWSVTRMNERSRRTSERYYFGRSL